MTEIGEVKVPSYVLKTASDRDLYVVWSTVVDNITAVGTRADCLADGIDPERLDRADRTGTSCKGFEREGDGYQLGAFAGGALMIRELQTKEGWWWLPRENLYAYAEAVYRDDYATAESDSLLRPVEDD